jgi:small subunit ribosomal protein S9
MVYANGARFLSSTVESLEDKYAPKLFPKGFPSADPAVVKYYATGRRKTSSARVWICEGSGEIIVNGRTLIEYFPQLPQREHSLEPFFQCQNAGLFDLFVTVKGGGVSGQAGAIRLGISRALDIIDTETFRPMLREQRMLTRDSRRVERKKPGQKKARKQYQWVKR